jgi:hypothetical protein
VSTPQLQSERHYVALVSWWQQFGYLNQQVSEVPICGCWVARHTVVSNKPREKPQSDGLQHNGLTFLLVHQAGYLIQMICWKLSYHQMIQNFQKKLFAAHGKKE